MNKIFYITLSIGILLIIANIATYGAVGVIFLFPIFILIDLFGFDLIKFITGCQGEGCWLADIIGGSIIIFVIFVLIGYLASRFYEKRKTKQE